MATRSKSRSDADTDSVARTAPVDVTNFGEAAALMAAWRGIQEFFGGQLDESRGEHGWEIIPPSKENPDGGIVAYGFSIEDKDDVTVRQLLSDLAKRNRRVNMFPNIHLLRGWKPAPYTDPQDITNFSVSFMKGSEEDGSAKTPAYVRDRIAEYKSEHGLATRRGPRRKTVRLDEIDELDEKSVENIPADKLEEFLRIAQNVQARRATSADTNTEVDTTSEANSEVAASAS